MASSKAGDLINQLIEATIKMLEFAFNILDASRVQKLLTIRNQKIGLVSDDTCLPECNLHFSLNCDLMMFNKILRNACLRARATLNELRVCRLRYPNTSLVLEATTKVKYQKLQRKIQEFDEAVRADKMIARRDLRDFREISIIFSQLEHDLKLLICSLECSGTMKDTVLFAAPITDVMTVLSIVLNRLERLGRKAALDEKRAKDEQIKVSQEKNNSHIEESNMATLNVSQQSSPKIWTKRTDDVRIHGKNTNRTSQQRQQHMKDMIDAVIQQNKKSNLEKHFIQNNTKNTIESTENFKESNSIEMNNIESNLKSLKSIDRHYKTIKSNMIDNTKKFVSTSNETFPDDISLNRRKIKHFHKEFILKWTNNARHACTQNHIMHDSNTDSDRMSNVDLKIKDQRKQDGKHKCHHHSFSSASFYNNYRRSSSSTFNESSDDDNDKAKQLSSLHSTSLSSIVENELNIQHKNTPSNNSATIHQKFKTIQNSIDCKVS